MAAAAIAALAADLAAASGAANARHDRTPNIRPKSDIFADTVSILNAQSLPFSVKSDGTIKLEYEKDITFYLRYHTSGNFDIIGSLSTKTPVDKRAAMIDMICSTNYGIRVGCLIMDESDGEMRYRTNFYAGYLTSDEFKATFKRHHSRATATFFRYLPAIIEVRTTNVGGREAVRKIEAPNYSIAPPEYKTIVPAKRPISATPTPTPAVAAVTPTPTPQPVPTPAVATPATTPAPPVYQPPLQQQQQQNYQPQNQQQQYQQQQQQYQPPQYQQQNGNGYVAGAIPSVPLAASPPLPVVAPPQLPNSPPPPQPQPQRAILPPAVPSMATLPVHPGASAVPAQPSHNGYAVPPSAAPNGNHMPPPPHGAGGYAHAYNPHGYPTHDQYGRPLPPQVAPPAAGHPYPGHYAPQHAQHPYGGVVNHGVAPPQSPRTPTIPLPGGQPQQLQQLPSGPPPQYITPPPGQHMVDQWGRPLPNAPYNVPYTGVPQSAATTGNSNPSANPNNNNNNTPPAAYRAPVGGYPTHDQYGRPLPPPQVAPPATGGHYNPNPPAGVAPVPVPVPVPMPGQPHSFPQYQPPVAAPGSGRGNLSTPAVAGGYVGAPLAPGSAPVGTPQPQATPAPGSVNGKPDHVAILAELGGALNLADIEVQWSQPKHYRLGKGGMGEVWAGKWRKHTDVAVKVVSADSIGNRTEQRQLFMREMKINRDLRHHPNVVQFIGVAFDEQADRYLLITELCRYKSLSEVIREPSLRPRLTWPARKRMLREAALGVDYLHSERIVHMDIKPLNFLVTEHLQVKVGDFGLAKQLSVSRIHTSIQGMTPAYAAPEAMFEKVSSSKSDVFSFAVVMYEMMTLREPYTAEDLGPMGWMGLPQLVRDRDMRPPLPANMPIEQRNLLTRAWHRDPNQRPSMAELIAEIDRLPE